jgi:hypothetical protein
LAAAGEVRRVPESWSLSGLSPADSARWLTAAEPPDPDRFDLVTGGPTRVHAYVFRSSRLPEVRGASELLEHVAAEVRQRIGDGVLASQGGNLIALVPRGSGGQVAASIEEAYRAHTLEATAIAAAVPYSAPYAACLNRSFVIQHKRRAGGLGGSATQLMPLTLPALRRCGSCGLGGAAADPPPGASDTRLCASCLRKDAMGRRAKGGDRDPRRVPEALGWDPPQSAPVLAERILGDHVSMAETVDQIADAAGRIGVVYADGNGIGARLAAHRLPNDTLTFSRDLLATTEAAVRAAARATVSASQLELLTVGGDDVLAILPGDRAVPFAAQLCAAFETGAARHPALHQLTLTASVVVAGARTPIGHVLDVAFELLAEAKAQMRQHAVATGQSVIDVHALRSLDAAPSALGALRAGLRRVPSGSAGRWSRLHLGPMAWPTAKALWDYLVATRDQAPRAALYRMLAQAEEGTDSLRLYTAFATRDNPRLGTWMRALTDRLDDMGDAGRFCGGVWRKRADNDLESWLAEAVEWLGLIGGATR